LSEEVEFEVALSFASEQRDYVTAVASGLSSRGVKYFLDSENTVPLWGKNQVEELQRIYMTASNLVVMFISEDYVRKTWTNHERRSALSRAVRERGEYVLPARFDDAEVPGLSPDISFVDIATNTITPDSLASMIAQKIVGLGGSVSRQSSSGSEWLAQGAARVSGAMSVAVKSETGIPIQGAQVTCVSPNGTGRTVVSDLQGAAVVPLPSQELVTVLCGHPDYDAAIVVEADSTVDIALTLPTKPGVGSVVFNQSTGYVPGFLGRFAPISDGPGRAYVYIDEAAVNGDAARPAHFSISEPLNVEHSDGTRLVATFLYVRGQISLLRYQRIA